MTPFPATRFAAAAICGLAAAAGLVASSCRRAPLDEGSGVDGGGVPADGGSAGSGGGGGAGSGGGGAGSGGGGAGSGGGGAGSGGGGAGSGGAAGSGGDGRAGAGGSGTGGSGTGGSGAGGAGGNPCVVIPTLDRSCVADDDCFAALYLVNCCGTERYIGLRATERSRYQMLETQCHMTWPVCQCASGAPSTDDGSFPAPGTEPSVACQQGVCTTYIAACGHPCAPGTKCFTCASGPGTFAACSAGCDSAADCADPSTPTCQRATSGGYSKFCAPSNVACGTP
jgi:hypothetical protein